MPFRELSPELLERAKKELHEVPERREADIAALREWLKKQPHILAKPDDQTLITFLRGCKFSLERAKEKIDMYYTVRTNVPEFFKDRHFQNNTVVELLKLGLYLSLPGVDEQGRRVMMIRPGVTDPSKHKIEDQFKANFYMMDMLIREDDELLVNGIVSIIDLANVTLSHGAQMTPSVVKKLMICSQDGYPIRPKAVHYVYTPPMFDTVFNLFKSFAKDKIKKRLIVHGDNVASLHKHVPQRLLPTEYGGHAGTVKEIIENMNNRLEKYNDWFLSPEATLGVDESKRPGKPKTQTDLFGLEGSFRQLAVD